jgi:hypothetical protein
MANVEICLQAPDADVLAGDLAAQVGPDLAETKRLPTRGLDVITVISITSAGVATANVLLQWISAVRARKQRIRCTLKINGQPVEIDMPRGQFLKLF